MILTLFNLTRCLLDGTIPRTRPFCRCWSVLGDPLARYLCQYQSPSLPHANRPTKSKLYHSSLVLNSTLFRVIEIDCYHLILGCVGTASERLCHLCHVYHSIGPINHTLFHVYVHLVGTPRVYLVAYGCFELYTASSFIEYILICSTMA